LRNNVTAKTLYYFYYLKDLLFASKVDYPEFEVRGTTASIIQSAGPKYCY